MNQTDLKKLEELEMAMENAVSKSTAALGGMPDTEFTARLYSMMHEVKDMVEEAETKLKK